MNLETLILAFAFAVLALKLSLFWFATPEDWERMRDAAEEDQNDSYSL